MQAPVNASVLSRFGQRPGEFHPGIDYDVKAGTAVYAALGGTVIRASFNVTKNGSYGNVIVIDHGIVDGQHEYTLYAHLKDDSFNVKPGDIVTTGTKIGESGNTGYVTGANGGYHLHFEVIRSVTPINWAVTGSMGVKSLIGRVNPELYITGAIPIGTSLPITPNGQIPQSPSNSKSNQSIKERTLNMKLTDTEFQTFKEALAAVEVKGFENDKTKNYGYGKKSDSGNYLGRYQMGKLSLIEAKFMQAGDSLSGTWTGENALKNGINNQSDFLANGAAQDIALRNYADRNARYLVSDDLDLKIGNTLNGITVTKLGLLLSSHNNISSANAFFNSNGQTDPVDGNKFKISNYISLGAQSTNKLQTTPITGALTDTDTGSGVQGVTASQATPTLMVGTTAYTWMQSAAVKVTVDEKERIRTEEYIKATNDHQAGDVVYYYGRAGGGQVQYSVNTDGTSEVKEYGFDGNLIRDAFTLTDGGYIEFDGGGKVISWYSQNGTDLLNEQLTTPQNPLILDNKVDTTTLNPNVSQPGDTSHGQATGAAGTGWQSDAAQAFINQGGLTNTAIGNLLAGGVRPGNGSVGQTSGIFDALRVQTASFQEAARIQMGGNLVAAVIMPVGTATTVIQNDITKSYTENGVTYQSDPFSAAVSFDTQGQMIGLKPTNDTNVVVRNAAGTVIYSEHLIGGTQYIPTSTAGSVDGWSAGGLRVDLSGGIIKIVKVANNVDFVDPLTLDGGNDGTLFNTIPVNFDLNADGSPEALTWTAPTDPLLVMDLNGDGRINNGTELVDLTGNSKPINLLSLDDNADKKLDANDQAWYDLQIWTDRNQDGYASAGELQTLSDLGITSIDLDPTHIQTKTIAGQSNVKGVNATYSNGNIRTLWDVALSPVNTSSNDVTTTAYATNINKVTSGVNGNAQSALQAISSVGVAINLTGSGASQAIGSLGNDTLTGTTGDDWLIGGAGADTFDAGAGNDLIVIDAEDHQADINGGTGIDTVLIADDRGTLLNLAQAQVEVVYGGYGDDVLIGGGADNYFIDGAAGDDLIVGGSADDVLSGGDGADILQGGKGDDLMRGGRDNDQLLGGDGNDVLDGGLGDDTVKGETGNDVIVASGGTDQVDGGDGVDLIQLRGNLEDYSFVKNADGSLHTTLGGSWMLISVQYFPD